MVNPFFPEFVAGVIAAADERDWQVLVASVPQQSTFGDTESPGGSTNVFARTIGLPNDPIEATGVLLDADAVWSMWPGYLSAGADPTLRILRRNGVKLHHIHTSGHATAEDICDLVRRLGPDAGLHRPRRTLVLTARDAVADRVAGLDAGADDYLVKPFEFSELIARLRALERLREIMAAMPGGLTELRP